MGFFYENKKYQTNNEKKSFATLFLKVKELVIYDYQLENKKRFEWKCCFSFGNIVYFFLPVRGFYDIKILLKNKGDNKVIYFETY